MKYFTTDISKKKCSDAGMAAVLIMLLIGLFTKKVIFYQIGIPLAGNKYDHPRFLLPVRHSLVRIIRTDGRYSLEGYSYYCLYCCCVARGLYKKTRRKRYS